MKKLLLSLFGLLTLGLINFSSAWSLDLDNFDYVGNYGHDWVDGFNQISYNLNVSLDNQHFYCVVPTDYKCQFPSAWGSSSCEQSVELSLKTYVNYEFSNTGLFLNIPENYYIQYPNYANNTWCFITNSTGFDTVDRLYEYIGFHFDLYSKPLFTTSCSSVESDLASCQSSLATATGNLATCQSDLATCQNSSSSSSCSPSGSCTVNNKVSENILFSGSKSFSSAGYTNMFNYGNEGAGTYCVNFTSTSPQQLTMGFANGGTSTPSNLYTLYADQYGNTICLYGNKQYFNVKLNSSSNTINYEVYKLTDLLNDSIPCEEGTGGSCDYSEYESTINSLSGSLALCQSENSSLSGNLSSCEGELNSCMAGFGTGDLQWSALFINNIQHLGAPRINIMIPEEINWDYVVDSGSFDLDINGYNVDTEYIDGIIRTQNYKPTSEDFTKLVGMLAPYSKILIFCLFMFIIWAWIKKPFKSKRI